MVQASASNIHGSIYRIIKGRSLKLVVDAVYFPVCRRSRGLQAFYQEAAMWKRLKHPNVIPLLGITIFPQLQLVSEWMTGGDLPGYIKENPGLDRLGLAGVPLLTLIPR